MCLAPIKIKNPYCGRSHLGVNFLRDCTAQYIEVPCGYCASCLALKQSYIVQRSQMESLENDLFFCTLTYNNDTIPVLEVNGFKLKYVDISDFQNMIKRLRKKDAFGLPFRVWAVTEYGGKKHRPHLHVIFSFPKIPGETRAEKLAREKRYHDIVLHEWRRNIAKTFDKHGNIVANTRNPVYVPLCTYFRKRRKNGKLSTNFDFHWIDPSITDKDGKLHDESDVAFYVTKYTLKASKYVDRLKSALKLNLPPEEFYKVWSKIRPKALVSKKWGNPDSDKVQKHVRKGIDFALVSSDHEFPVFFNPTTGQTFPLAPFYKRRFYSVQDEISMFYKAKEDFGTNDAFRPREDPRVTTDPIEDYKRRTTHFKNVQSQINSRYEDEFNEPEPQFYQLDKDSDSTDSVYRAIDDFLDFDSLCQSAEYSLPAEPTGDDFEYEYIEFDYSDFNQ